MTCSLEEPQSSDPELVPSSPYAAAKWACSAYARMFHQLYRTPVVLLRIFMAYGPGQPTQKLSPYVILSALQDEAPKLSSGERLVDWIYVDDVIGGLLAAARATDIEGCTIDLGSGTLVRIREVVEQLVRLSGSNARPLFGALPPRPIEPVRAANLLNSYSRIGWKPVISLEQGLDLTVKWFRAQSQVKGLSTVTMDKSASYDRFGLRST
jgi:nucleoside-diphosphate-sugar epimerase